MLSTFEARDNNSFDELLPSEHRNYIINFLSSQSLLITPQFL